MQTRRTIATLFSAGLLAAGLAASLQPLGARAGEKVHKVALQITDNDPEKMNAVLNIATNISRYYADKGEPVEIQVVAFNAGLHMLRDDTSPVKERLQSFAQGMPNVSFKACNNTLQAMIKREGKPITIVSTAAIVPSGAIALVELSESGWTIIRP
jgi:intracellular sulfur oxidation DsrE/DsrF family protein